MWGAPSLGNLEDMLRKFPDMGISLHEVPFPSEGNLVFGEGEVYISGTLIDERRRALVVGRRSARDSIKGTLGEDSFTEEPERYSKCPLSGPPSP